MMIIKVLSTILVLSVYTLGFADDSKEIYPFDDITQEKIFLSLLDEIRCPKCQSSNLAGSNAPIANDLKREVYRLVRSGKNEEEVRTYLVKRYGNFIVYDPPFRADTLVLWLGPPLFFLLTLCIILLILRKRISNSKGIDL